jgi:hypothetical protein
MFSNVLIVKKIDDTNFVPIKYNICQISPDATAAATNCVIQCIRNGWDTDVNYNAWVSSRTTDGIKGTLGTFEIEKLDNLISYSDMTPSRDM